MKRALKVLALLLLSAIPLLAADTDVLTFVNGEQMSGQLVKVADGKVVFKSDMVGDVTVEWAKIKELKTNKPFAVIAKGVKITRREHKVPTGTLVVTDNKIAVGSETVPTDQAAFVVDQPAFEKEMSRGGFLTGWVGAVTAGVSLVEATQNNTNITTSFAFVRKNPPVDWMRTSSRTILDFSNSYGKVTQPNTPDVKTSIFHADAEHDVYFTDRVYGLGHLSYDHNFSQGLDLQQLYGGGLGVTLVKDKKQELDLKGDIHYEKQQFEISTNNQNLIGSEFAESYLRKLPRGMILTQGLLYNAAWNNTSAYTAQALLGLAAPLSKKFSLSINLLDGYLNNPPPGFKKNSFQFTTGITYTVK